MFIDSIFGPGDDTYAPHCGRRILSSVLRRKKRKPSPKKDVKEVAGVPSAKRALGTWRLRGCGVNDRPPGKGSQKHLGASRGIRKRLETGKVLGAGSKTYFIYVLRPSILIKSVWFLHHHGGGRVESLVKK